MSRHTMDGVIQQIRHLAEGSRASLVTDQQLLQRFIGRRDESAFAALVRRHGPMILGLCRRLLHHVQDAEDVFQATFLVLARRASAIRKQESAGSWLYGVAYRLALKAKTESAKRRSHSSRNSKSEILKPNFEIRNSKSEADPLSEITWREVCTALDEELARLPDRCRAPLVLCYLQSKTQDEALQQLGWSKSTFRRRLEEGRKKLCLRLTRRGITLSAGLWATLFADQGASAAISSALMQTTVKAAIPFAAGEVGAAAVSPHVILLAKHALKAAVIHKIKWITLLGIVTAFTTGIGLAANHALTGNRPTGQLNEQLAFSDEQRNQAKPDKPMQPRLDLFGDPLPEGAIARLGTVRWRMDSHGVDAMAVAADSKSLVTANVETGITIWDMATGKHVRRIPEKPELHKEWFSPQTFWSQVALTPDGRKAVFMPNDPNDVAGGCAIHVVDVLTGKEIQTWRNPRWSHPQGNGRRGIVSGDGKILVTRSGSQDGNATLQIWSTESGNLLRELPATPKREFAQSKQHWLALSADGKTLAWVGEDNACPIHEVDVESGEERHQLAQHDKGTRQIAMSPNGQWLLSASGGGLVQIWDLKTGRLAHQWPGKEDLFLPMAAFSPDSQKLVLTRSGHATRVLDVASGKELWQGPERISASKQDVYAFTSDGKILLVAGLALGNVIHRYEMATGKRLLAPGETSDATREITFAPDERTLYTLGYNFGEDNSVLRSWDMRTGKQKSETRFDVGWGVKFSPNGQIVVAINDDDIHIFESSTGKERWHLTPPFKLQSWNISFDGKLLAAFGQQALILWDLRTGKEMRRFAVKDTLWHFVFTSDGQSVIGQPWPTGSNTPSPLLQSWDLVTGQERLALALPPNSFLLSFSPDGKTAVLMCEPPLKGAHLLVFVEVITGLKRMEIEMSQIGRIWSWPATFASSPDGNFYLLSDGEGQMQVFDAFSGERLGTISGHGGSFSSYSFSASGRLLATLSSSDTTGLIWDAQTVLGGLRLKPIDLSHEELVALWDDLESKDAIKAYQAIGRLASGPRKALAWLGDHVKPVSRDQVDKKRLDQLLAKLDSDDFAVREQATKDIEKFEQSALPSLERVLQTNPSMEVRKRIEVLMERIGPERLRPLRAIEALEHIGTPEAQELLKNLSQGAPEARLTQEAKGALTRLQGRTEDAKGPRTK